MLKFNQSILMILALLVSTASSAMDIVNATNSPVTIVYRLCPEDTNKCDNKQVSTVGVLKKEKINSNVAQVSIPDGYTFYLDSAQNSTASSSADNRPEGIMHVTFDGAAVSINDFGTSKIYVGDLSF